MAGHTSFRPEFPLALRIQVGKRGQKSYLVAQATLHTDLDEHDPFKREALEHCHFVRWYSFHERLHAHVSHVSKLGGKPLRR